MFNECLCIVWVVFLQDDFQFVKYGVVGDGIGDYILIVNIYFVVYVVFDVCNWVDYQVVFGIIDGVFLSFVLSVYVCLFLLFG